MILFTILVLTFLILAAIVIMGLSAIGAAAVFVFGDVIVCMVFIGLILMFLFRKKDKK